MSARTLNVDQLILTIHSAALIHTARTQLKSMFRKTGRRSQGQLLMLAARIATLSSTRG
jgi:hypothetical protein